jgi:hypothetical protein
VDDVPLFRHGGDSPEDHLIACEMMKSTLPRKSPTIATTASTTAVAAYVSVRVGQ